MERFPFRLEQGSMRGLHVLHTAVKKFPMVGTITIDQDAREKGRQTSANALYVFTLAEWFGVCSY
jgi:hypothetical protein